MKPSVLAAVAVVLLSFTLPLQAQGVDPLWRKTLAHSALVKQWVPEDTATTADASVDGKHDKARTRSHLKGWEKDKPVYDTVQLDPTPEPGKPGVKIKGEMTDASNMSDELMRLNAAVRRTDGQLLHGKSWTLFEVSESKGPIDVSVRLWVDPLTGVAHQVESKIHGTFMFDMFLVSSYVPHPKAGSLPERMDFKLKVLVPFQDAKAHIASTMDNWIPRPN